MLDVIYDASPLGVGCCPPLQTGIFNVAHMLVQELVKLPGCRVHLSAFEILPLVMKFLEDNPLPGAFCLPPYKDEQALGFNLDHASFSLKALAQERKNLKKYHWILEKLTKMLLFYLHIKQSSVKGIDYQIFKKSHLYHTTCGPIPDLVRKFPLRACLTIHDFMPLEKGGSSDFNNLFHVTLKKLKSSDIIITPSEYVRKQALQFLNWPASQVFAVHHGINPLFHKRALPHEIAETKKRYGIEDTPYFIAVGRQDARKNYTRLIKAFLKLSLTYPEIQLVLVGPQSDASSSIEPYLTDKRIVNTNFIRGEDLSHLYQGAMAFIHPSLAEGFGLPLIEAMASGTPVITSPLSCLPEIAADSALYISDPLDEESIYKSLLTLYCDTSLSKELSQKSVERAKNFSWRKSAEATYEIYKKVS